MTRLSCCRGTERHRPDFKTINHAALAHAPAMLKRWLPDGKVMGHEYYAKNPRRADHSPGSFKVNLSSGRWADFAIGARGGDLISLAAYLFSLGQAEAARRIGGMLGVDHES